MDISIGLSLSIRNILGVGGVTPPLDDYTGAQTAYSISRKLRTAYSGSAIRVRESSGDTELDIGFDSNGDLDEVALLAHTGSNSGYVVTAYDQSGNSNDWTQATANKQPRIVLSGVVDKVNGKPAMFSDTTASSQDNLSVTLTGAVATTAFHVYKTTRDNIIVNSNNGTSYFYGVATDASASDNYLNSGTPATYVNGSDVGVTRNGLHDAVINIQVINAYTSLDLSDASWTKFVTNYTQDAFTAPDYIQETIIYDSDKSSDRTSIETNINDYYTIY
jgi:hypothetical protein